MSNAFKSTDTIKTMDQLVKAKILLTKKKKKYSNGNANVNKAQN